MAGKFPAEAQLFARHANADAVPVPCLLLVSAVHHHLGRGDLIVMQALGVVPLPVGELLLGEGVLPAEVVPVIDME